MQRRNCITQSGWIIAFLLVASPTHPMWAHVSLSSFSVNGTQAPTTPNSPSCPRGAGGNTISRDSFETCQRQLSTFTKVATDTQIGGTTATTVISKTLSCRRSSRRAVLPGRQPSRCCPHRD